MSMADSPKERGSAQAVSMKRSCLSPTSPAASKTGNTGKIARTDAMDVCGTTSLESTAVCCTDAWTALEKYMRLLRCNDFIEAVYKASSSNNWATIDDVATEFWDIDTNKPVNVFKTYSDLAEQLLLGSVVGSGTYAEVYDVELPTREGTYVLRVPREGVTVDNPEQIVELQMSLAAAAQGRGGPIFQSACVAITCFLLVGKGGPKRDGLGLPESDTEVRCVTLYQKFETVNRLLSTQDISGKMIAKMWTETFVLMAKARYVHTDIKSTNALFQPKPLNSDGTLDDADDSPGSIIFCDIGSCRPVNLKGESKKQNWLRYNVACFLSPEAVAASLRGVPTSVGYEAASYWLGLLMYEALSSEMTLINRTALTHVRHAKKGAAVVRAQHLRIKDRQYHEVAMRADPHRNPLEVLVYHLLIHNPQERWTVSEAYWQMHLPPTAPSATSDTLVQVCADLPASGARNPNSDQEKARYLAMGSAVAAVALSPHGLWAHVARRGGYARLWYSRKAWKSNGDHSPRVLFKSAMVSVVMESSSACK